MAQKALLDAIADMLWLKEKNIFAGFDEPKMKGFIDNYISVHYPNKSKAAKQEMRDAMMNLGDQIINPPPPEHVPTSKELLERARKEGANRSVGMGARFAKSTTGMAGDVSNLVGNVVGMTAAAPYNVVAGAGNSISRTHGDDVLGTPNLAPIMQTAGMAYGAIPQAAVSGLGQTVGNAWRNLGNDYYDSAQERQFQQNQYLTTQEVLNSNITPSQAMLGGRIISGQNWSSKQGRKNPAVAAGGGY